MLSHGFLPNSVDKYEVKKIETKIKKTYLTQIKAGETYFEGIHKKIPDSKDLVNVNLKIQIASLLKTTNIKLEQVELHILLKNGQPIPPHQDNFYHCLPAEKSLKVLIPLSSLNRSSGGLGFLNSPNNLKTLNHSPSSVNNFSAVISKNDFERLNFKETFYDYKIGDSSYHFVSSIHFSDGNKTFEDKYFLVYRYQCSNAKISKKSLIKYELNREKHLEKITNIQLKENI